VTACATEAAGGAAAVSATPSKSNRQLRQKRKAPVRALPHCGQNSDTDPPFP
jgi:hypothetical protein